MLSLREDDHSLLEEPTLPNITLELGKPVHDQILANEITPVNFVKEERVIMKMMRTVYHWLGDAVSLTPSTYARKVRLTTPDRNHFYKLE